MDKNLPLVSIVTPSFNQGRFIEDAILSVKNQDYPFIEHVIVDGVSTDNTLEILEKYEDTYMMRFISEPDAGQSDAINKGFKIAKGEIIGWINSDDGYFDKSAIRSLVQYFNTSENIDVIYGDTLRIDEHNLILFIIKSREFNYNCLRKMNFIMQPSVFFRRCVIDQFELNVNLEFAMDYDFWLRIGKEHNFQYINRIVAVDRIHKERKTVAQKDAVMNEARLVSSDFGDFGFNWLDKLSNGISFGVTSVYTLFQIQRLFRGRYEFVFDLKLDDLLHTLFRQLDFRHF